MIIYAVPTPTLSAINFVFQSFLTDVVQTVVHIDLTSSIISVVPSGSLSKGLSMRLSDASKLPGVRENLPKFSDWPTFPQLFVKGELIGCCDIVMGLYQSGELQKIASD